MDTLAKYEINPETITAPQLHKALESINTTGIAAKNTSVFDRYEIIANVAKARKWTATDIETGEAAQFLETAGNKTTLSTYKSFASPLIRGKFASLKKKSLSLAATDEAGSRAASNIITLLVTKLKDGAADVKEAGKLVVHGWEQKALDQMKIKNDITAFAADTLKRLTSKLGGRYTKDSVTTVMAHIIVAMDELEEKAPKES